MAEDPDGWMFTSKRSKSGHVEQMSRPFQRCVIGAELDPGRITPHTLRRTALTRFSKQEQRPKAIQKLSGHRSLTALRRYTHPSDEQVDAALDRMSETVTAHEQGSVAKLRKS
ncbi:MAG: phage integrase family protein [Alphaproteobacteria bacterium]|nr:phage integrase family protein [Alphaproteobacteria bacterium]